MESTKLVSHPYFACSWAILLSELGLRFLWDSLKQVTKIALLKSQFSLSRERCTGNECSAAYSVVVDICSWSSAFFLAWVYFIMKPCFGSHCHRTQPGNWGRLLARALSVFDVNPIIPVAPTLIKLFKPLRKLNFLLWLQTFEKWFEPLVLVHIVRSSHKSKPS